MSQRREVVALLAARPVWTANPLNKPQCAAAASKADVLGYGGAAGGGKTDLLLGLALTEHKRSIIFRREVKNLRPIIDRARELLGNVGSFNENTGVWRGLPGGRQLEFGGVKDLGDEQKYRGNPHDFIGFDEADQLLEYQVRFLMGWLRSVDPEQRCRVALGFNPPGSAEGRWIISFFAPWIDRKHPNPAKAGELRYFAQMDEREVEVAGPEPFTHKGETITPRSRTFIPARVQDNSYMPPSYLATLQALPEPLRSQVLNGDFTAGMEDAAFQVVPTAWIEAAMERWKPDGAVGPRPSALGVDVARGGSAKTVFAKRYGRWFAPLEKHPGRTTPDGPSVATLVSKSINGDKDVLICLDVIGVGSSAYDWCCRAGLKVWGVNFSLPCKQTDKTGTLAMANLRAYGYWSVRELLDPSNGYNVALPPDSELLADLTAPTWSAVGGIVKVEPKEDIVKRIGRSPDCADAVVNSVLLPG